MLVILQSRAFILLHLLKRHSYPQSSNLNVESNHVCGKIYNKLLDKIKMSLQELRKKKPIEGKLQLKP